MALIGTMYIHISERFPSGEYTTETIEMLGENGETL